MSAVEYLECGGIGPRGTKCSSGPDPTPLSTFEYRMCTIRGQAPPGGGDFLFFIFYFLFLFYFYFFSGARWQKCASSSPRVPCFPKTQESRWDRRKRPQRTFSRKWRPGRIVYSARRAPLSGNVGAQLAGARFSGRRPSGGPAGAAGAWGGRHGRPCRPP